MKKHLMHLAMCTPMLVIAGVLLIGGASIASLLPLMACLGMMTLMMMLMPGHGDHAKAENGERQEGLNAEAIRR